MACKGKGFLVARDFELTMTAIISTVRFQPNARIFESLGGTCSRGESSSSGSRASYFQQLAADSETSNCVDFNLASIITFKDEQMAHSMTDGGKCDQVADFHTHRRRPNYDSRKRKFQAIQRPGRSGYLNNRTSLTISIRFDFQIFYVSLCELCSGHQQLVSQGKHQMVGAPHGSSDWSLVSVAGARRVATRSLQRLWMAWYSFWAYSGIWKSCSKMHMFRT